MQATHTDTDQTCTAKSIAPGMVIAQNNSIKAAVKNQKPEEIVSVRRIFERWMRRGGKVSDRDGEELN